MSKTMRQVEITVLIPSELFTQLLQNIKRQETFSNLLSL